MSTRSRSAPWFAPSPGRVTIRLLKACRAWEKTIPHNRWMFRATRRATTSDIPEERVRRFLKECLFGETK